MDVAVHVNDLVLYSWTISKSWGLVGVVVSCVTVEGISQKALENDMVQTRTALSLWQPCMIFFCLRACLGEQTGV